VGPRTGLDDVETRTRDPSAVQPLASRHTDCAIPVLTLVYKISLLYKATRGGGALCYKLEGGGFDSR
jgi:hypothetical protein